jgi:thiol-disulfide isomerase/thioredoxin
LSSFSFVVAIAAALTITGCSSKSDGSVASTPSEAFVPLAVGDTIAPYAATAMNGDTVRIGARGPLTFVNVWATWCTSCREEMADLEALKKQFGARGLRIVAVSVDDGNGDRVKRFAEHEKLTMTIVHDPAARIQEVFSTVGVPESYLVSSDGRLLWRQAGGLHGAPQKAVEAVEQALKESAPPT